MICVKLLDDMVTVVPSTDIPTISRSPLAADPPGTDTLKVPLALPLPVLVAETVGNTAGISPTPDADDVPAEDPVAVAVEAEDAVAVPTPEEEPTDVFVDSPIPAAAPVPDDAPAAVPADALIASAVDAATT